MGLTLTDNPIETVNGQLLNVFSGFNPVDIGLNRIDETGSLTIDDNGGFLMIEGIDSVFLTHLELGDSIYFFGEGQSGEFNYDGTGEITEINATDVTLDIVFVEQLAVSPTVDPFINGYQNYFVEMELFRPGNENDNLLGFILISAGKVNGDIVIDISIINSKTNIQHITQSEEIDIGRIEFDVRYREVFDNTAGVSTPQSYTTIDDSFIVVYTTKEDISQELLVNEFDKPKIWIGYETGVGIFHSNENNGVTTLYDELDLNNDIITSANELKEFMLNDFGLLWSVLSFNGAELDANTVKLNLYTEFGALATSKLQVYYPLDEQNYILGTPNRANELAAGKAADDTGAFPVFFIDDHNAVANGATRFITTTGQLQVPADFVDLRQNVTICMWFRLFSIGGESIVFQKSPTTDRMGLRILNFGPFTRQLSAEAEVNSVVGNVTINTGQWYHLAIIWNDVTGMKIYIDATLDNSNGTPVTTFANFSSDMFIGKGDSDKAFNGALSGFIVYNKELTQPEILAVKNAT